MTNTSIGWLVSLVLILGGRTAFSQNCANGFLLPSSVQVSASQTPGQFEITAQDNPIFVFCSWTVQSNNPDWITKPLVQGYGIGFINYTVQSNSGPARQGTIEVDFADIPTQYFAIRQAAAPEVLTVGTTGSGIVRSNDTYINCPGTCSHTYGYGDSVTLTASANSGNVFTGWSGNCSGTGTCQVTMNGPKNVSATFVPTESLSVTIAPNASGKISSTPPGISCPGACSASFEEGSLVTLSASPNTGYTFGTYSGDCSGQTCSITLNTPQSVTADFMPSAVSSFSSNSVLHVFYLGSNLHVYQLVYSAGNWAKQDLTNFSGGASAANGSSLTSFGDSGGGQHVFYIGTNQHIYQLVYTGTNWGNQDLTSYSGGTVAMTGSSLASLAGSGVSQEVFYFGTNQHVYQLVYTGASWSNQDLIMMSGGVAAVSGSSLTSFWDSGGDQHIFYIGANQHVYQLAYAGGGWVNQDLNEISGGAPAAVSGSSLISFVDSGGGQHVFYIGTNQHIYQLVHAGSTWGDQDLTNYSGGMGAVSGSGLGAFADSGGGQHVFYGGANQHVYQLVYTGASWASQDLSSYTGDTLMAATTQLSAFFDSAGQHVFYRGTNGDVYQLIYSGGLWTNQDLTSLAP